MTCGFYYHRHWVEDAIDYAHLSKEDERLPVHQEGACLVDLDDGSTLPLHHRKILEEDIHVLVHGCSTLLMMGVQGVHDYLRTCLDHWDNNEMIRQDHHAGVELLDCRYQHYHNCIHCHLFLRDDHELSLLQGKRKHLHLLEVQAHIFQVVMEEVDRMKPWIQVEEDLEPSVWEDYASREIRIYLPTFHLNQMIPTRLDCSTDSLDVGEDHARNKDESVGIYKRVEEHCNHVLLPVHAHDRVHSHSWLDLGFDLLCSYCHYHHSLSGACPVNVDVRLRRRHGMGLQDSSVHIHSHKEVDNHTVEVDGDNHHHAHLLPLPGLVLSF